LTLEVLTAKDKDGTTPLHLAAASNQLCLIPKPFLTETNLCGPETQTYQNQETPLHFAARAGCLNTFPKEILTEENLTAPDSTGYTPMHWAARCHQLDQIPPALLTKHTLLHNPKGRVGSNVEASVAGGVKDATPLYEASQWGSVHQIPKDILTENHFSKKTLVALVHTCSWQGFLQLLPNQLLTSEYLLSTIGRICAIDRAAWNNKLPLLKNRLPLQTLLELQGKSKTSSSAQEWVQEELRRASMKQMLQTNNHPEL